MVAAARIYFLLFGLFTVAGGIIGYVKAGSIASIVAGTISGLLLLAVGFFLPQHRTASLILALLVSLLLLAQFAPKFFHTGKIMPAGAMSVLSLLGAVAAVAAWLKD